jgi:hypothetical protein
MVDERTGEMFKVLTGESDDGFTGWRSCTAEERSQVSTAPPCE